MNKDLLHSMMAYCSKAERCMADVEEKLRRAEASQTEIEAILEALVQLNFIDEQRYAQAFVNDKFKFNKWGRVKIAYALRQKKVSQAVVQEALDTLDETAYRETLQQLLWAKKKSVKGTAAQQQAAVIRFALSRGFEYECIRQCLP